MRHDCRHRRKSALHLHLEPLEDRTALSGWSTPVTPVISSIAVASQTSANSTPDDDSTYASTTSSITTSAPVLGPSLPSVSPSSASATTSTSGTYSTNTSSFELHSSLQTPASLVNSESAASYAEKYAIYVAQEAAAALRVAEVHAAHILQPTGGGNESPPVSEPHSTDTVAETAAPVPESQSVAAVAPIGNGRHDGEAIIPLHPHAVRSDWTAQLILGLDDADTPKEAVHSSEMRLATAGFDSREGEVESGTPLAGAIPVDVEALEQRITQLFAYLGSQAQELTSWPGVMNVGAWLAAGVAATAAYELARRSARRTSILQFSGVGWQDPRLGPFTGDDRL